jgi:hypothetical protein
MPSFDEELLKLSYHRIISSHSRPKRGMFYIRIANQLVEKLLFLNSVFERLWPINKPSTNIFAAVRK